MLWSVKNRCHGSFHLNKRFGAFYRVQLSLWLLLLSSEWSQRGLLIGLVIFFDSYMNEQITADHFRFINIVVLFSVSFVTESFTFLKLFDENENKKFTENTLDSNNKEKRRENFNEIKTGSSYLYDCDGWRCGDHVRRKRKDMVTNIRED